MAEDVRENEMNSGVPVKMRGIDADGNSVSPTLQEVADALPGEQKYDRGVYYSLPKPIVSIHKPTGGNETKTITLFKIEDYNTSHFNFFEIFTIPFYAFVAGGYGKRFYGLIGILGVGIEQGGAFRAKSRRIGCILLIGTCNNRIVCQSGCRAHGEMRVGGIAAESCLTGGIHQLAVGGTQFFVVVYLDSNLYVQVFHRVMVYCN